MPSSTPSLKPWGAGKRVAYGGALGLLVGLALYALRGSHALETLELRLVDMRTRAFLGDRAPDPRIVLCLVHEEDHQRWTRDDLAPGESWPWPLFLHEYAFRALAAAQPRVVLVDLLHVDRGQSADDVNVPLERRQEGWFGSLIGEADQATSLGAAYSSLGNVVLGFQLEGRPTDYEQEKRVALARARFHLGPEFMPSGGVRLPHATLPVSGLIGGCRVLAFTNVHVDEDGVQRRAVAVGGWGDLSAASLPLAGAWLASDGVRRVEAGRVTLGSSTQELDAQGGFYVNFRGLPNQSYRTIPPGDLIQMGRWLEDKLPLAEWPPEGRQRLEQLKGAILIYGAHLAGAEDTVSSPFSGKQLGPEYQATILDNLLHGDGRVAVAPRTNATLMLVLCVLAGALGTLLRGRGWPHLPALALLGLLVALAYGQFSAGRVLDLFTPALGLLLTWGGTGVLRLVTEGRRNKWLESTFSRYVSPDVVEALKKNPALLALGGRRRDLTVLFSDVAKFTKISEELGADQVVLLLNRYLTTQSEQVMATGGVIDKFIGDAVMAFWGDPLDTPDHALRAIRAALRCQAVVPTLQPLLDQLGVKDFHMRIGVNSGPALVGNMGSEERFDYTCMGDTVNLASRLEGANKAFGTRLIVGADTYRMVEAQVLAKRLADLHVVGRKEAVSVYEVLALREDAGPDLLAHASAFEQAHGALRRGDLGAAQTHLAEAARLRPGDGATAWLGSLAASMRGGTAPSPWDGAVHLTEK